MYFVIYKEDWGGLGRRAHVFSMMYEFFVGFVVGLGVSWTRRKTLPVCDVACQVEPPPPSKPVAIPERKVRGVPELMHFWDF